ncbi:MAG: hypothetical protein HY513_02845 [Candidatus Aenigmarchaeota archaeon]|nr:hypothetical protein [Candidatus Aenigmarchaeota archaeon]
MAIVLDEWLNILINGKPTSFTIHIRDELDQYRKDTLFACKIIDEGEKKLVSGKENRYESRLAAGNDVWIVVWFDMDECILLKHIGKEKR